MLLTLATSALLATPPIIGGYGDFKYQYMPDRLQLPPGTELLNAHGLVLDPRDGGIILTYEPVHNSSDTHCMIHWSATGLDGKTFGPGPTLCAGTPHGLRLSIEAGEFFLYHANNAQSLHKTTLDGTIVWALKGPPSADKRFLPNKPTWFAAPPGSGRVYMADGYGSNYIHAYTTDGTYTGYSFGGRGTGPGTFETCHSINWDERVGQLIVSDRENHRHQFFRVSNDPAQPPNATYVSQFTIKELQRPCNLRNAPDGSGVAVVPALEGPVGILNASNSLVSLVDVAGLLGKEGHLHPHDALLMPSGDLIVATWNPGKLSYWKRLRST